METKEINKDFSTFRIDELIKSTFQKIAEWHNDDSTKDGLKQLSIEIAEEHLKAAFKHLGLEVKTTVDVELTPEEREKFNEEKEKLAEKREQAFEKEKLKSE